MVRVSGLSLLMSMAFDSFLGDGFGIKCLPWAVFAAPSSRIFLDGVKCDLDLCLLDASLANESFKLLLLGS